MAFDKANDKIAITVPHFTLLRSQDGVRANNSHSNEPFLVTLAVDGLQQQQPKIMFNQTPFPNIRRGDKVEMLGDGHLVYGPANPGEFVTVSVLLMESDADVREAGEKLEKVIRDGAVKSGMKAMMSAGAGAAGIAQGLAQVTGFIARFLKANDDDEVLRVSGTFFRDRPVPFDINRRMIRNNQEASLAVQVIPLDVPNGQGPTTRTVVL